VNAPRSDEGARFWDAFKAGGSQVRVIGTTIVGFDYVAIERLALAKGCPAVACATFFHPAESSALAAMRDGIDGGS
jgi:hypothetical protein